MRLITRDDFIETYSKLYQKGAGFILSKFSFSSRKRTVSTFTPSKISASNYWIIPEVKKRWNLIISGDPDISYEEYIYKVYLEGRKELIMLSPGSGISSHEMIFASKDCFQKVECLDLSKAMLDKASEIADKKNLSAKMEFRVEDVNTVSLPENYYDLILFNSSLHHFKNLPALLDKIYKALKASGLLVLIEYTGPSRLQFRKEQIKQSQQILHELIPAKYRKRLASGMLKKSISGPGYIRMLLTDPSEAVESDRILPEIHNRFKTIEEKQIGGDILMLVLKDIAHNFLNEDPETKQILENLFKLEDRFIEEYGSDFVFGIYKS